jgi:hypothetical protein
LKRTLYFFICTYLFLLSNTATAVPAADLVPDTSIYTQTSIGMSRNNDVKHITKEGKVCSYSILSLVAFGNSTIAAAKKDGKITNVAEVNNTAFSILGLYGRYCTVITGN